MVGLRRVNLNRLWSAWPLRASAVASFQIVCAICELARANKTRETNIHKKAPLRKRSGAFL